METNLQVIQFKNLDVLAKILPAPVRAIGGFDDEAEDRVVILVYQDKLEEAA